MYAMQYEITLPADYDMQIIRDRVAKAGPLLDDRVGLGLKAYVIRERGVNGSPVNQYAPFYLWHDVGAMGNFLVGGGFENIIRSFGRVPVQHWTGLACEAGPARGATPRAAARRLTPIPVDPDLDGLGLATRIEDEIEGLRTLAARDGVHTAALALDPRDWTLLQFVLWADDVPTDDDATERYEVLHLSAPDLSSLPQGRHW